jgi:hypothetical protein
MGHTLTPISFYDIDIPIKEVISASRTIGLKHRNFSKFAKYRGTLSQVDSNPKHLMFEFMKASELVFIEFLAE